MCSPPTYLPLKTHRVDARSHVKLPTRRSLPFQHERSHVRHARARHVSLGVSYCVRTFVTYYREMTCLLFEFTFSFAFEHALHALVDNTTSMQHRSLFLGEYDFQMLKFRQNSLVYSSREMPCQRLDHGSQ